jgi:hypothetical protein
MDCGIKVSPILIPADGDLRILQKFGNDMILL